MWKNTEISLLDELFLQKINVSSPQRISVKTNSLSGNSKVCFFLSQLHSQAKHLALNYSRFLVSSTAFPTRIGERKDWKETNATPLLVHLPPTIACYLQMSLMFWSRTLCLRAIFSWPHYYHTKKKANVFVSLLVLMFLNSSK